jgi:hypothetical protein
MMILSVYLKYISHELRDGNEDGQEQKYNLTAPTVFEIHFEWLELSISLSLSVSFIAYCMRFNVIHGHPPKARTIYPGGGLFRGLFIL